MRSFTGRVLTGTLFSAFLCLAVLSPAVASEQNQVFERSGIHFPGGFDLNTVGDLRGKVVNISRPSGNGPIILNIETEWEKYAVVTCPPWYWDELKIKITVGEGIRVIGSKSLGKDANLYIIAQEIQLVAQGRSITLRDKSGTPVWSGPHGKMDPQQGHHGRMGEQK